MVLGLARLSIFLVCVPFGVCSYYLSPKPQDVREISSAKEHITAVGGIKLSQVCVSDIHT